MSHRNRTRQAEPDRLAPTGRTATSLWRIALVTAGAILATAVAVGVAVAASQDDDADAAAVTSAEGAQPVAPEVIEYFGDLRDALSPLLLHVRALPATITALQERQTDQGLQPTQVAQLRYMAEDFATARDLVGRVPAPEQAPAPVSELMSIAAQLYRQSALAITDLATASPAESEAVLGRAAALHQLGDRLIDQSRRVLQVDKAGPDEAEVEYRYADPVPTVASVTSRSVPEHIVSGGASVVTQARQLLAAATASGLRLDATRPDPDALLATAGYLEQKAELPGEDVITARMAILLAILADDTEAFGDTPQAEELRLIAHETWNAAGTMPGELLADRDALSPARIARGSVWRGGVFNGTPPPIAPGAGPGSGLPGGLPAVDTSKILGG